MDVEQHSLLRTTILHLSPGVLILIFFITLAPILRNWGLPSLFTQFLAVALVLIPFELGYLFYQGRKRNNRWSLTGIVCYRQRISLWNYVVIIPSFLAWALICFLIISPPIENYLITNFFSWLPDWFFLVLDPAQYSRTALFATWVIGIFFNALAGPVVEELYFRGYLLPRISRLKGWAPLLNALLFSVYHFFTPWQNPGRILALLPGTYLAQWKKNIYLVMIPHCLLNSVAMLLMLPLLFD